MLTEQEIRQLVDPAVDVIKSSRFRPDIIKGMFGGYKYEGEKPSFYDGYLTNIHWRDSIAVHTVKGVIPTKILELKAPNQSPEELQYVIDNYKQITLIVGEEFLNTIGRGMHSSNWSVTYQEDAPEHQTSGDTLRKYLEEDIEKTPLRMNYESWWRFVLPSDKLNDAMAVIAFRTPQAQKTTIDQGGNEVIAGDELPNPYPQFYACDKVLSPIGSKQVLIDTGEKSMVQWAGRKQQVGFIWDLYDETHIYRITQIGDFKDYKYEVTTWFRHELGFTPVIYLMGRPVQNNGGIVWQSPFLLVTDILDEIIMDNANLRSIKASSAYPQKVTVGRRCRHSENFEGIYYPCDRGYIRNQTGEGFHLCGKCNGSGYAMRTGPMNTLFIDDGSDELNPGTKLKATEALHFAEPSTEHPKNLREEINHSFESAKSVLHLRTTSQQMNADPQGTATSWALDEKSKYAFLSLPVDQIFDIGEFGHRCIGGMRYGKDFKPPVLQRPITYDFNSEADYLNNIAVAQKSGAPPIVVNAYLTKYLKASYYDSQKEGQIYDLILATDRIIALSQEEINTKLSRNLIAPWEAVLHDSSYTLIAEMIRADANFLEKDIAAQREALIAAAKLATPATQLGTTGRLSVENILAGANGSV